MAGSLGPPKADPILVRARSFTDTRQGTKYIYRCAFGQMALAR